MSESPLVVIVGATGSGKTSLSLTLAREFDGEIVSCDSVAVYRNFEIGTAKPTREERATIPHHLIDVSEPTNAFNAGEYARVARQALRDITSRGKLPIVVGGTGLYLRALIDGLSPAPKRSEEMRNQLRKRLEEHGAEGLYLVLKELDPKAAENIHPNDSAKVIRAIEVIYSLKQPLTDAWKRGRDPLTGFRILRLGLNPDRARLYERINDRAASMFESGLTEETRSLLDRYDDWRHAPALKSLGYLQAVRYIRGEIDLPSAISSAQQGHRNYAKRQLTWFRREPGVEWIEQFGDSPIAVERARNLVLRFLGR